MPTPEERIEEHIRKYLSNIGGVSEEQVPQLEIERLVARFIDGYSKLNNITDENDWDSMSTLPQSGQEMLLYLRSAFYVSDRGGLPRVDKPEPGSVGEQFLESMTFVGDGVGFRIVVQHDEGLAWRVIVSAQPITEAAKDQLSLNYKPLRKLWRESGTKASFYNWANTVVTYGFDDEGNMSKGLLRMLGAKPIPPGLHQQVRGAMAEQGLATGKLSARERRIVTEMVSQVAQAREDQQAMVDADLVDGVTKETYDPQAYLANTLLAPASLDLFWQQSIEEATVAPGTRSQVMTAMAREGLIPDAPTSVQRQVMDDTVAQVGRGLEEAQAQANAGETLFDTQAFLAEALEAENLAKLFQQMTEARKPQKPQPGQLDLFRKQALAAGYSEEDVIAATSAGEPQTDAAYLLRMAFNRATDAVEIEQAKAPGTEPDIQAISQTALEELPKLEEVERRIEAQFGETPPGFDIPQFEPEPFMERFVEANTKAGVFSLPEEVEDYFSSLSPEEATSRREELMNRVEEAKRTLSDDFIPKVFGGRDPKTGFAVEITDPDEARKAYARTQGFDSWEDLQAAKQKRKQVMQGGTVGTALTSLDAPQKAQAGREAAALRQGAEAFLAYLEQELGDDEEPTLTIEQAVEAIEGSEGLRRKFVQAPPPLPLPPTPAPPIPNLEQFPGAQRTAAQTTRRFQAENRTASIRRQRQQQQAQQAEKERLQREAEAKRKEAERKQSRSKVSLIQFVGKL
jgi:hypothetical protein